jgi:hypothetical protein
MYWAGFIASDGNIAKDKPRITLALKSSDKNHLEKFKKNINFNGPIVNVVTKDFRNNFKSETYYKSQIRFTSKKMVSDLKLNFNITSCKSKTLQFPDNLKDHPLINHFIRGLIDGDGGIYYKFLAGRNEKVCNVFLCGTENIVKSVESVFTNNLNANGTYYLSKNNLSNIVYRNLNSVQNIIYYIYNNSSIYLNRKKEIANFILTLKPRKISLNTQEIKIMIDQGKLIKDIAKDLGYSYCTVRRRLIEDGLFEVKPRNASLSSPHP